MTAAILEPEVPAGGSKSVREFQFNGPGVTVRRMMPATAEPRRLGHVCRLCAVRRAAPDRPARAACPARVRRRGAPSAWSS